MTIFVKSGIYNWSEIIMDNTPELIVMLTYNDMTVMDAASVFESIKDTDVKFVGMKEEPLPPEEMKKLYARMKECGKTTALEVVAYTEEECMQGARLAAECGVDILMGTIYSDAINDFCKEKGLKYMPFVGEVTERPSVLGGEIEDMINEANSYIAKGAYGIDLLGYRYTGDAAELNRRLAAGVKAPVCIAGSVNSFERLDELKEASPWAFTIGSAFFDKDFDEDIPTAVGKVCDYMKRV